MNTLSSSPGCGHDGVRVRSAAGLHGRDELGMLDVGDVEHADAAHALLADRFGHAAEAAVGAAVGRLRRHEQQVAVDRDVVLRRGAEVGCSRAPAWPDSRCRRSRSRCSCPGSRSCPRTRDPSASRRAPGPVGGVVESMRMFHAACAGIPAPGLESDARIGRRRGRRDDGRHGGGITAGGGGGGGGGVPRPPRPAASGARRRRRAGAGALGVAAGGAPARGEARRPAGGGAGAAAGGRRARASSPAASALRRGARARRHAERRPRRAALPRATR